MASFQIRIKGYNRQTIIYGKSGIEKSCSAYTIDELSDAMDNHGVSINCANLECSSAVAMAICDSLDRTKIMPVIHFSNNDFKNDVMAKVYS